jgi:mannan endo-1,4-beta-mannosidase
MYKITIHIFFISLTVFSFSINAQNRLSDAKATIETQQIYNLLQNISGKNMLFGHHNTNQEGIGWEDMEAKKNKSDVKSATGDFPALFSFDFNRGFKENRNAVLDAHRKGALITISWHLHNMATNRNYRDTTGNVMSRILPKGDLHKKFKKQLKKVAIFAKNLKDDNGKQIPIIFRPFHENTGNWFWWGAKHCSPEVYKKVWQFTITYLRDVKKIHNLIYAYSPSRPSQLKKETYETRYPGNNYADIIGFDHYWKDNFSKSLLNDCRLVVKFAEKNNKVSAITEFGVSGGIDNTELANWYVDAFLNPLKNDSIAKKVAYAVTWANRKKGEKWVPVKTDIYFNGFLKFYKDNYTWFLSDLNKYKSNK